MIKETITVEGKTYTIGMSALIPRIYRNKFRRDLVIDMQALSKAYKAAMEEDTPMPANILGIFEDVAWCALKHGGSDVGDSPDEWLESLDGAFSVYEVLPVIIRMWTQNNKTTSVPKKK